MSAKANEYPPAADLFDAMFRFKIGDIIIETATLVAYCAEVTAFGQRDRYDVRHNQMPLGVAVVERHLKQCHGGIQGFYLVQERMRETGQSMFTLLAEPTVDSYSKLTEVMKQLAPAPKGTSPWRDAVAGVIQNEAEKVEP